MSSLLRSAKRQHVVVEFGDDPPGQLGEVFDRPELRAAIGPARIERDDAAVAAQAEPLEHRVGRSLVGLDRGQLEPRRLLAAADRPGEFQVGLDHRHRRDPSADAARIELAGQQRAAAVADVADPLLGPAQPRHQRRAKRIGHQHGHVKPLGPHPPGDGPGVPRAIFRAGIEEPLLIEPRRAGQHVGQIRAQDSHDAGLRPEMPPQRPQRRRGHRHVAKPIRKKNGNLHGKTIPLSMKHGCHGSHGSVSSAFDRWTSFVPAIVCISIRSTSSTATPRTPGRLETPSRS